MSIPVLNKPLNLFYKEPDPDRWFKYDRYPRKLVRRIIRGKERPGGVMMVALNLMEGLDKLGIPYHFNDYRHIKKHPNEIACIIGKPHLLYEKKWNNPVILGAGIFSHPSDRPDIFSEFPNLRRILVPGPWMEKMFNPFYGNKVIAWPTGIDTERWHPLKDSKTFDFLIYDKVRWEHEQYDKELIEPIKNILNLHRLTYHTIKYGSYTSAELKEKLSTSKAVIFLCEHESQGLAYQQILATNTPILAWDRGGYWQDPFYYPRIKFGPVSSVPNWDERCGEKFNDSADFDVKLTTFLNNLSQYQPRQYILDNLTLERCAQQYVNIHQQVEKELNIA